MATRRVVLQGDRIFFRHQAFERVGAVEVSPRGDLGLRRRADAHGGRRQLRQHPPGPMAAPGALSPRTACPWPTTGSSFPLSIYLGGTEAIHAHLGVPPGGRRFRAMADVFRRIEVRFEGEEKVDGLRCVKLRVDRWFQPERPPMHRSISGWPPSGTTTASRKKAPVGTRCASMSCASWRPGSGSRRGSRSSVRPIGQTSGGKVVVRRTETIVEKVDLAPRHEAAFFRDVAIPAGLPVFTIKDRRLVGSMLPEPFDDDWGRRKLAELAARVADQERRYDDIEVKARATMDISPSIRCPIRMSGSTRRSEERSIVRGGLAYSIAASTDRRHRAAGRTRDFGSMRTMAEWTRIHLEP